MPVGHWTGADGVAASVEIGDAATDCRTNADAPELGDTNRCSLLRGPDDDVFDVANRSAVECITEVCTEFLDIHFVHATPNFFIRCKQNTNGAMLHFRMLCEQNIRRVIRARHVGSFLRRLENFFFGEARFDDGFHRAIRPFARRSPL